MTLPDLLRAAKAIAPHLRITAWDRSDYEAMPFEIREGREVVIEVSGPIGPGSMEGIRVEMDGPIVKSIKPGRTVEFWQADPIMRAWREVPMSAAEVPQ